MFKSDQDVIGGDADRDVVATDSFVMKGTTLSRGSLWAGNPAEEARAAITSPVAPERPLS